ncbi:hypothetical protein NKH77_50260 [Streptomyces sp. M19]
MTLATGSGANAADVTLPGARRLRLPDRRPYTPPEGVSVVTRAHEESPADGLYNICYVNAFQTQPGAEGEWDSDLLLKDDNGDVVYDSSGARPSSTSAPRSSARRSRRR